MRITTLMVLGASLLFVSARPAPVRADAAKELKTAKVKLRHLDHEVAFELFGFSMKQGELRKNILPSGIEGVLSYPLDNSLLFRGTPESVEALQAGLAIVDVEIETREGVSQIVVSPAHTTPEKVRDAVLTLPHSGFARIEGKSLVITGSKEWVTRSLGRLLESELASPAH